MNWTTPELGTPMRLKATARDKAILEDDKDDKAVPNRDTAVKYELQTKRGQKDEL